MVCKYACYNTTWYLLIAAMLMFRLAAALNGLLFRICWLLVAQRQFIGQPLRLHSLHLPQL
jgi:hypothetical protein